MAKLNSKLILYDAGGKISPSSAIKGVETPPLKEGRDYSGDYATNRDKNFRDASSSVDGLTSNSYVTILSWDCLGFLKKTLILACIDQSNDLKYRIKGVAMPGSKYYDEICAETVLAHGAVQPIFIDDLFCKIDIEMMSAVLGRPSAFNIDYCGGPRPKIYPQFKLTKK